MSLNSATFFRIITSVIFVILFSGISFIGYSEKLYFITLLGILLAIGSAFIWLKKSYLSYRFLYPGMICFLIFTILPILFSILISFTNLGTGHFFSKDQASKTLLQNQYLPENPIALTYQLLESEEATEKRYLLKTTPVDDNILYSSPFKLTDSSLDIPLTQNYHHDESLNWRELSLKEVFALSSKLRKIQFIHPSEKVITYHRTDLLIEKKPLYSAIGKDTLRNNRTGEVYVASEETGFFREENSGAKILPGFYTFVGARNYFDVFTNPNFKKTFFKVSLWTFIWAIIGVFLSFSLGISLAIFLNDKNFKGKAIYRNLLILPYSIPFFISVLVFKGMLSKDFGIINEALKFMTISPIPWLEDGFWAKVSCLMVNLWLGFPYMFLVTTGILQSIPESVYEAAKMDGANRWHRFRHITFPMVLSSITPLLIGSFAFNLGNFVGIYLLTGGGPAMEGATTPAGETDILISYTYRLAFEGAGGQLFGMASSIALFIFVIITILTIINFRLFNVKAQSDNKTIES
jgi:maltose/maltodextrin transport system permease protein